MSRLTLKNTMSEILNEVKTVFDKVKQKEIEAFADVVVEAKRVFVVGAGRVGTSSRGFAMRLTHLRKTAYWVLDDTTPGIGKGDLLIANSGSGGSASTCNIVHQAKEAGATIATITANPKGEIAQLSDAVIVLPAQTYKTDKGTWSSIMPMGSQFELSLWILQDVITLVLMEKMKITEFMMTEAHRNLE